MGKAMPVNQRPIYALALRLMAMLALSAMLLLVKRTGERGIPLPETLFWRQFLPGLALIGWLAARGEIIVTLDGDGQNDPADAPRLVERLQKSPQTMGLIGGARIKRQDSIAKKLASRLGNGVRNALLKDGAADTGCGLKVFRREAFLRLPYFDHIHRYLPALILREGYEVAFEPVSHRARTVGASKYTNLGRLWASASDLLGVMWLIGRSRLPGPVAED